MLSPKLPLLLGSLVIAGCGALNMTAAGPDAGDVTPDDTPDSGTPAGDLLAPAITITVGGDARVTAGTLNLRSGPGTTNAILTAMPCGARVSVVGGPQNGWWNVTYQSSTGWASGTYLVADGAFDALVCGGSSGDGGTVPVGTDEAAILARAKLGVGYSYYWGHGSWRSDGTQPGVCMGAGCPNCTHSAGPYGADCSGFVGKCWQVPSPSPITTDSHPYATYNFYNQTTHWTPVPRTQIKAVDALVHNADGSGHMVLFESGSDPWGNLWLYEARGCSTGIVHNLRSVTSDFITIRREGL